MKRMRTVSLFVGVFVSLAWGCPFGLAQDCNVSGSVKVVVDTGMDTNFPTAIHNGSDYGLVNSEFDGFAASVLFSLLDSLGNPTAGPNTVSDAGVDADFPALAWGGSQFLASWDDFRDEGYPLGEIYANRIDSSGNRAGADVRVTNAANESQESSIAFNPADQEFALVWNDLRIAGVTEIYFNRIDATGALVPPESKVSGGFASSLAPDIAWNGAGYGVVWIDDRNGVDELFFNQVDATGASLTGDLSITTAHLFSLAGADISVPIICWNGTTFGVAFVDDRDGNEEIYFVQLNTDGTVASPVIRVTDDINVSTIPDVVWDGQNFRIAYVDDRFGGSSIMMSVITSAGIEVVDDALLLTVPAAVAQLSLHWTGAALGLAWDDDEAGYYRINFALIDCDLNTAVNWASFSASRLDKGNDIHWSTLSETGTFGFLVLATADPFTPPAPVSPIVPSVGPAFLYRYTHPGGDASTYYRIQEVTSAGYGSATPLFPVTSGTVPAGACAGVRSEPAFMTGTASAGHEELTLTWSPPAGVEIDSYRVFMRSRVGRRPVPIGTRMEALPGKPATFSDASWPALRGARGEYRIVARNNGTIVAMSDWIENPYATPRTPSRSLKRQRGAGRDPGSAPLQRERILE